MDLIQDSSRIERTIENGAALCLGGAGAFAALTMAPVAPVVAAVAAALAGGLIGRAVLRRAGSVARAPIPFECIDWPDPVAPEEPLELVDRLAAPDDESRVIRLFAPESFAAPAEMATRIDHWLDAARQRLSTDQAVAAPAAGGHGPRSSPASAALHEALADIRRSLR